MSILLLESYFPQCHHSHGPRPLVQTYAIANLEEIEPALPATVTRSKRTRNADSTESDGAGGNNTEGASQEPPESPAIQRRGQPAPVKSKPAAASCKSTKAAKSKAGKPTSEAAADNSKAVPPPDPLPAWAKRNNHPEVIDLPRSK